MGGYGKSVDLIIRINYGFPLMPMPGEKDHEPEYHLRKALRHLNEAQNGNLRQTNATAVQKVSDTIATVLRERKEDERA